MSSATIQLGGRKFRTIVESTVEHDIEVRALMHEAGFDLLTKREGEAADDFVVRMLGQMAGSRKDADFAGVLLVPSDLDDTEWTPEVGEQTTTFIKKLTAQADKMTLRNLGIELLGGFINAGLLYSASSPKSLNEGSAIRQTAPEQTASDRGRIWSGGFLRTTRAALGRSFAYLFARPSRVTKPS
jgi:hypothetical protein